ncbi:hypothetical protein AOT14_05790 [Stenotrophomonas acidaminiphila]|uniref:Uncharacterized protein n=1 Tax=Stenotrophomonas acidaminiphila TaxID=128780 RepID=A0A0S1AW44_9GAMM|nr:hypothetical protein AOT14_05790 [Stenotrophomonas acidaminiphila]
MPEGKYFSCRCSISGNVSLALTNYSLLDQTSARWTVIHSCRRPHKIPAHTFKELRNRPQRLLPSARRFRPSEPPIIAGFSASSTPRFEVRLCRFFFKPEGFPSERAAYYGSLFVAVNTCVRVTSTSFLRCQPTAGGEGAEVCVLLSTLGRGKYHSRAFMPRQAGTSCPAWLRRGVRRRPAVPARTCACPPAAGLRNPAAAPSAHPRRRYRPPSPHAP